MCFRKCHTNSCKLVFYEDVFHCVSTVLLNNRIFSIVRPRRLLYMAIDGVAPRAKMNQQRSRRFRAAKESIDKREDMKRIRSELLAKGCC